MSHQDPREFEFTPDLGQFRSLARRYEIIPVELKVLGDGVTPMTLYQSIRRKSRYSVLLESVQGGEATSRYSFIGAKPREVFGSQDGEPFLSRGEGGLVRSRSTPLEYISRISAPGRSPCVPGLPPFVGGSVGYIGYDAVSQFEDIRLRPKPGLPIPEIYFLTFDRILAFDHREQTLSLIQNAVVGDANHDHVDEIYDRVREDLLELYEEVSHVSPLEMLEVPRKSTDLPEGLESNFTREEFEAAVMKVKEYILAGDIFQGVISRRFTLPFTGADPFDLYRVLRFLNPSPYMFLLDFGSFQVVGASPEALVRLTDDQVEVRPIAGTRPRGGDDAEDQALAEELKADPKERAEHIMLVDLGRNDVGRVAEFGTVKVNELMEIERFSHVMHLVSRVTGTLREGLTAEDAFRTAFPAGTVTGAPKIRAMEIIDELEPHGRGIYSGGIGYFSFNGQMDSCIAIRSLVIHEGKAHIQAGAGIVADSDPEMEYLETLNKAQSLIQAIRSLTGDGGTGAV